MLESCSHGELFTNKMCQLDFVSFFFLFPMRQVMHHFDALETQQQLDIKPESHVTKPKFTGQTNYKLYLE